VGEVRRLSGGTMRIDIRSRWWFGRVRYETGLIGDMVLRPGGLVVPIEEDLATIRSLPQTPFGTQVKSWLVEAFAKAGMSMVGSRLAPSSKRRDCALWG
jgi:hypothetical protein